jgi:RNA polymerase sigma factor (sigma-70 family)
MTSVEHLPRSADDVADPPMEEVRAQLEGFYREHGERVLAICVFVLRDRHEAEDAAQQVFVSALRALLRGAEPRDPGAWLATIARNESSARAGGRPTLALNTELRDVTQEDPAAVVVRRDELARVWKAIEGLPASQRDALLLREMRGLAYDELVTGLQLSHPSVRSLLNRARRTLRSRLEQGAAAFAGAPWINVFARVFGDTSTPALSSATRTAAVGLGALALTGGAVVAPSLSGHAQQGPATHAGRHASASPTPASRGARAVDAAPVEEAVRKSQESLGLRDDHRSRRGSTDGGHRGSDGVSGSGRPAEDGSTSGGGSSSLTSSGSGEGSDSGTLGTGGGSGDTSLSGDQTTAVTSGGGGSSGGSGTSGSDGGSSGSTSSTSGSDGGSDGGLWGSDGSSSSSSSDGGS